MRNGAYITRNTFSQTYSNLVPWQHMQSLLRHYVETKQDKAAAQQCFTLNVSMLIFPNMQSAAIIFVMFTTLI